MFDDQRNTATQVSIQEFSATDPTVMEWRIDAHRMQWEPATGTWSVLRGVRRNFSAGKEVAAPFDSMAIGALNFSPDDIRKKQERPEEMNYPDLRQFIEGQQHAGHDVARWLVDLYAKISFPFASAVVVLFGVPFASYKRRSGPGIEFGIAIAVTFLYMVLLQVSQAFGYNGDIDPLLTAWLANGVFFAAGVLTLLRVPK
jgi:lipopolysaccharide export system permease protein